MPLAQAFSRTASAEQRLAGVLLLLLAASVAIIGIAFGFEFIGKYRPCPLCLVERYAYYFAILGTGAGLLAARSGLAVSWLRLLLLAIAIGFIVNTGLGIHHSGVEWKWWAGPATCSGALPSLSSGGAGGGILDLSQPVIRCDEAPWRFLGLSFAGWNAVLSAALALFALTQAGRRRAA
jgi:disulfide bond formation protein DsbB